MWHTRDLKETKWRCRKTRRNFEQLFLCQNNELEKAVRYVLYLNNYIAVSVFNFCSSLPDFEINYLFNYLIIYRHQTSSKKEVQNCFNLFCVIYSYNLPVKLKIQCRKSIIQLLPKLIKRVGVAYT